MVGTHSRSRDIVNPLCRQFIDKCTSGLKNFEIGAISELADMLVQFNLWDKFIAIYPFIGGDSNTHSLNLKNPMEYKISWSGSLIFNRNGVTGNGGYGNTNITINKLLPQNNTHISAYNRTPFNTISGTGRLIGVNTLEILNNTNDIGALELNFNKNSGIVGYVYNKINNMGGYGYTINEMINQNISGTGLMIGLNSYECYLNNKLFGYRFPLLPTDIHPNSPRKLLLFGNQYDGNVTSAIRANLSFASVGYSFNSKEMELFNTAIESFQMRMFRSVM